MSYRSPDAAPLALCLGGMDPSGGAGLVRDALALGSLGVHPMVLPIAETIQNGTACLSIQAPAGDLRERLQALSIHLHGTWGVKIGMCAVPEATLRSLLDLIESHEPAARIWDPIQAPTAGESLHDAKTMRALAACILKRRKWIVCPNLQEASSLAGFRSKTDDPAKLASPLLDLGACAVWLKGGHGAGPWIEDLWVDAKSVRPLGRHRRLPGERRGTGCFVASTWLGLRLLGMDEIEAAMEAAKRLRRAWRRAIVPGGQGRSCLPPEGR